MFLFFFKKCVLNFLWYFKNYVFKKVNILPEVLLKFAKNVSSFEICQMFPLAKEILESLLF